jgi:phage-related protein (TIGR01555 family)
MDDRRKDQAERIVKRYAHLIEMQTGKAVRPYRADGYVNMMNKYGTSKDTTEGYRFRAEPVVPDELLTMYYEGNGLFAKIIDTPAEEAIKHGFTLESTKDQKIEDFYTEALDELDWEETAMTAIRWARLFGGSIAVMMINDGRGIDEPLDWRNIRSIDDIRVYDRSVIQPDYQSMFSYDPRDPFRTRGSRLGMPEFYHVTSRTGTFTVHDSRCLVFQNGILPENTTNSIYQLWGIPEYVRINRAIRDAEVAHGSATKLLDRSVQAVYKMKDLAAELATEEGEDRVLRRLQTIDMARGLLNSITIDSEGEDYDFRQFQFSGVSDVIDSTCNFLSALTSIPQTILFGRSPAGMNATGDADLENWYNYLERIQKRMVKKNLRYLLSVIFQAGVRTGEVDEVPKIKVEFNPLWSLSDTEQADLDQKRAQTQFTRAQTAQLYIDKQVIDPSEVRAKLADSEEFDVENMLDEYDDEDLFSDEPAEGDPVSGDVGQNIFEQGQFADYAKGVDLKKATEDPSLLNREMLDKLSAKYAEGTSTEEHKKDPGGDGEAPTAAPAATKLPQDMSDEERQQSAANAPQNRAKASVQDVKGDGNTSTPEDTKACVGVLVVSQGKVLSGTRKTEFGYGLICGPGGHIKDGESPKQAAFREAEEEFGISPKELIPLGRGPMEPDTGIEPYIFLCTEYEGEPHCVDGEMADPQFRTLEEIEQLTPSLFQPFADDVKLLKAILRGERDPFETDADDVDWVTINGTHTPLEGGVAIGGGKLHGKSFSKAKSSKGERRTAITGTKSFADVHDADTFFGVRPDRKLRSENREEYDRLRSEYENSPVKKWNDSLSGEETDAIMNYAGSDYSGINGLLRGEMTERMVENWNATGKTDVRDMIQRVESGIDKFELKEPITVYRTCEKDVFESLSQKVGSTFRDNAFTSTTVLNESVASGNVRMEINVPAGKGIGAYIGSTYGQPDEHEFLLQRGTEFTVRGVSKVGDSYTIKMDVTGREPQDFQYATKEQVIERWKRLGIYEEGDPQLNEI